MDNQTSEGMLYFKKQVIYINAFFIALFGITVIIVNAIFLWALHANPHRTFNRPKIVLDYWHSFNAFLMGLMLAPLMIADEIVNETALTFKNEALRTSNVILIYFLLANVSIIHCCAAVEGTTGLSNPHWSIKFFTRKNIRTIVVAVHTVNLFYSCLYFLIDFRHIHLMIFTHVFIILPVFVNLVLFLKAFLRIRKPVNANSVHDVTSTFTKEKTELARKRTQKISGNFIKTASAFMTPVLMSSIAFYVYAILNFFYSNETDKQTRWRIVLDRLVRTFLFIFPAFSPLILLLRIPEFKNAANYVLRKTFKKK